MLKNNPSQFPHDKFGSAKHVKFNFQNSSPPKKQSPLKQSPNKLVKGPQSTQSLPKQRERNLSGSQIPSHGLSRGKYEETLAKSNSAKNIEVMRTSKAQQNSPNPLSHSFSAANATIRLQDLCSEDKQKIGELIKTLANEKEEKERLRKELEARENQYQNIITNLTKENDEIVKDSIDLQSQFKYSLGLLKAFQEKTVKPQSAVKQVQQQKQQKIPQQYYQPEYEQHEQQDQQEQQVQEQHHYKRQQQEPNESIHHQQQHYYTQQYRHNQKNNENFHPNLNKSEALAPNNYSLNKEQGLPNPSREPFYEENNADRRLLRSEPGQTEQMLLQERLNQDHGSPQRRPMAIEAIQREEKTVGEISRLKSDIENLASSFKKINFSPDASRVIKESSLSKTQTPVHEQKAPSPIKLVENYKLKEEGIKKKKNKKSIQINDDYENEDAGSRTLTSRLQAQKEIEKPPKAKKQVSKNTIKQEPKPQLQPQPQENTTSSDEDDLAIAQKWLNLRKQKIKQINEELSGAKTNQKVYAQEVQRYEQQQQHQQEEEERNEELEEEYEQEEDSLNRVPNSNQYYERREAHFNPELSVEDRNHSIEMRTEDLNETHEQQFQQHYEPRGQAKIKSSPSVKPIVINKYASATKLERNPPNNPNLFKKIPSSASKAFENVEPAQGLINLNQMNFDDLVNLKRFLDEKIGVESNKGEFGSSQNPSSATTMSQKGFNNTVGPGTLKNQKAFGNTPNSATFTSNKKSPMLIHPPVTQDFFDDRLYYDAIKSLTSVGSTEQNEINPNFTDRFGRFNTATIPTAEAVEYEKRSDYRDMSKQSGPVDSSIMRDFDSIAHTLPKHESYKVTDTSQETYDALNPTQEVSKTMEEDSEESSYEKLYEEKLKEFLKVRERMLKANKIKDQGLDLMDILKSTSTESKRSIQIPDKKMIQSIQKNRHTNSPPSVTSVGKFQNSRHSERDPVMSQESLRKVTEESKHFAQNHGWFHNEQVRPMVERIPSEAKTPDYGYARSEQSIKWASNKYEVEPTHEEEVEQLTDDFYDENLFDLVDEIDKRDSLKQTPTTSLKPQANSTSSKLRSGRVEDEFNSLFNTVRTMFSNNDDTTTDRIREKLIHKFDKSDLITSKLSSDDDESISMTNMQNVLQSKINQGKLSERITPISHGRPSKTDSSFIETDTSILMINKKIDDMKKNKKLWK